MSERNKWMRLRPGEVVAITTEHIRRAHKIAHYWRKRAKRPRSLRIQRIAPDKWLMIRDETHLN